MAASQIKYPTGYSHREAITFPFTPAHSGIATILIARGDSSTAWTYRNVEIKENGVNTYAYQVALYTGWSATSVSFPVIAGNTYTVGGDHAGNVVQGDARTNYVY